MTLVRHELRQGRRSLLVWTAAIAFFMAVCVFLYPEMKGEMEGVGDLFASMGAFSAAFSLDSVNFGTLPGYYAIECGNVLGLGGALFASLVGVNALAKEEKDRTAEFLLTHPVGRARVVTEKWVAVLLQVLLLNAVVFALSTASVAAIGEAVPWTELWLLHLAYLLVQTELAGVCFGLSAFLRRGGTGAGLGIAVVMYFLNIVANLTDKAAFLKHITPFAYAEGADIIADKSLDAGLILPGMALTVLCVAIAYWRYTRKDIH